MKKVLISFITISIISILITGCASMGNGKNAALEAKNRITIENLNTQISSNAVQKLDTIAGLSYGVNYSLGKVVGPPREVTVAMDLNQRVVSLSGSPSIDVMKDMKKTIDKLTSILEKERTEGKKLLDDKDEYIIGIQSETKTLLSIKDIAIERYMQDAHDAAANADAYKLELQDYEGWFGLKAVYKGLLQFIKSAAWILGIGSVLFLILRLASLSNPIAASIFSIFNMMGSWIINFFAVLFPKAIQLAGNVSSSMFDAYKSTLIKLVDAIQLAKSNATAAGKQPDIDTVLDEVAKSMNYDEKKIVEELKWALHWK